jgi:hypothetical protein
MPTEASLLRQVIMQRNAALDSAAAAYAQIEELAMQIAALQAKVDSLKADSENGDRAKSKAAQRP